MDFLYELLITALLSILLPLLLGSLFSLPDAADADQQPNAAAGAGDGGGGPDLRSDLEVKRGPVGIEATDELETERIEVCKGNRDAEPTEIRSGAVGMGVVGGDGGGVGFLQLEEIVEAGSARKGVLLEAEETMDADLVQERTDAACQRGMLEDVEIDIKRTSEEGLSLGAKGSIDDAELVQEMPCSVASERTDAKSQSEMLEDVEVDTGRTSKGLVDEEEEMCKRREIDEANKMLEAPRDSDLLVEGKCLLEEVNEEEWSEQKSELTKNDEERLEKLGIAEGKNVRSTEEEIVLKENELLKEREIIENLEASLVGLYIEVNETKEMLQVSGDSNLLTEGKSFLEQEQEERSEKASTLESIVGGEAVEEKFEETQDDKEKLQKLGVAEEKNAGIAEEKNAGSIEEETKSKEEMSGGDDKEQSFLDEDDEWEGIEKTELEKRFSKAAAYVGSRSGEDELSRLSGDDQMRLYGLYKVATEGPCYDSQPMTLKIFARAKWNAWQKLGNMNPEGAMEQYMDLVSEKFPGWKGEKQEEDIKHEESYSWEVAAPGARIPCVSLILDSKPNSETKRPHEGSSSSNNVKKSDA
ncbi:acyl-CoA-binding domain-containing protein 3-like isoform X1 [Iris pallida]|uniref:Acyl-CoA-binding domain-containing protein 3-like isoform X1 n=1 Tax=Iris pallida TaxID=29817 RepID=A0AAX6GPQ9_IRIPA|nr:acyl-CoA-binding domain-containing protein 3-like isoform X1 [Iris pallida]